MNPGTLRIGLLGFGTVGSSFAEVLAASTAATRITHVFNRGVARKRLHPRAQFVPAGCVWTERVEDVLTAPDVDCIVELMGGLDPAEGWLRTALGAGKHVVTANKQLIAYRGTELAKLANERGVHLLYNAAVAGGVPVIPGIAQGLGGDQITRLAGILNGTCNFILSAMESGADYGEVLATAQKLGYAEADPTADVDGFDARAKLCILARLALGVDISPDAVPVETIATLSAVDFAYAKELTATIRQVSRVELCEDEDRSGGARVVARVAPMLVPRSSPVAWSHGTQNMVVTSGRFGGDVVFSGHGAGGHPTAVAVLSDVLAVAGNSAQLRPATCAAEVSGNTTAPFYLRFVVADEPGIVAAIAGALADVGANIDSILQHRGHAVGMLPFVVTTEPCAIAKIQSALETMAAMRFMMVPPLAMQILTVDDRDTD